MIIMPWTDDFAKEHIQIHILRDVRVPAGDIRRICRTEKFPPPVTRYHDLCAERFSSAFADTVGGWCRENGIALTGHMMDEPTREARQVRFGEAMRSYRSFGLPGIDMLLVERITRPRSRLSPPRISSRL